MATASEVLRIAAAEVGVVESPPGSNRTKYGAWYGMNGVPWCAIFLSWVFAKAGMPEYRAHYTPSWVAWFKARGMWHAGHAGIAPGDVVFYDFPDSVRRVQHVGIVQKVGTTGILAIEGNTAIGNDSNGGQVMFRQRAFGPYIVGYGRPAYTAAPVDTRPAVLVYQGSPEAALMAAYPNLFGDYQTIVFPKDQPPAVVPKGSFGFGTDVPGWAQIAGTDRYETLRRALVERKVVTP